ncbi:hypothetical protein [Streptomyces sp. NPDC047014]|uniref:hypothetical protein n=1 Tax=Streptomyces sp. NPDC047014 TaxID=3155736 RepID=UPI003406A121
MDMDTRPPAGGGDGCLAAFIRIPVKIVAVLVVLPVRVVWELLTTLGRAAHRHVLGPLYTHVLAPVLRGLGRLLTFLFKLFLVWPWVGLWRYLLLPAGRALAWVGRGLHAHLLSPAGRFLAAYLLRPLGTALAWAGRGLARLASAAYRHLLTPVGHALAWLVIRCYRYLLRPVGVGLYRYVLTPAGRLLAWAWHVAGLLLGLLWRGGKWVGWVLVGWPAAQVYRYLLTPLGHAAREVWRTARGAVREARAAVRRALFGTPPVEPGRSRARTLGSTTAAGNTPAPEISLRDRQG